MSEDNRPFCFTAVDDIEAERFKQITMICDKDIEENQEMTIWDILTIVRQYTLDDICKVAVAKFQDFQQTETQDDDKNKMPKRPTNSYMIFASLNRKSFQERWPTDTNKGIFTPW